MPPAARRWVLLFNNVAVAAKYALQRYNLHRVAVVDFDAPR